MVVKLQTGTFMNNISGTHRIGFTQIHTPVIGCPEIQRTRVNRSHSLIGNNFNRRDAAGNVVLIGIQINIHTPGRVIRLPAQIVIDGNQCGSIGRVERLWPTRDHT